MKAKLLFAEVAAILVGGVFIANAQEPVLSPIDSSVKLTGIADYVPAQFAFDNLCKLTMKDFNDETGNLNVKCIDSALSTVADIDIQCGENCYTEFAESGNANAIVTWDSVVREVVASSSSSSIEDIMFQLTGHKFEFSKKYVVGDNTMGEVYTSNDISFVYDSNMGWNVLSFFFIYDGTQLTKVSCSGNYSVDLDLNTDNVNKSFSNPLVSPTYYDYDNDVKSLGSLSLTQTLFNDDEDFEYILPVYGEGKSFDYFKEHDYLYYNSENSFRFNGSGYKKVECGKIMGFRIVREDGSEIQSVSFGEGFDAGYDLNFISIVAFGGKRYLNCKVNGETGLYEIKSNGSGVQKVASFRTRVYPSVVDRDGCINVEFGDEASGKREMFISDISGRRMYSGQVDASQTRISVPASNMSAGMNMVTVVENGKISSTKVIVKQ